MKLPATGLLLGAAAVATPGVVAAEVTTSPSCTAIAIGGEGSQQAYVAGALQALTAAGAEYDVVVSTSASVLAAQAAAAGASSAAWAAAALKAVNALSASDMFTDWSGGQLDGLTKQAGLYNATASASVYAGILGAPAAGANSRTVVAVGTSLATTLQVPLPVSTTDVASSVAALVASAAAPTVFTPTEVSVGGAPQLFVSGNVRGEVNIFEAVAQCRALGAADADITVDVVYTQASELQVRDVSGDKTLAVDARGKAITEFVEDTRDVLYAKQAHPDVQFRYKVSPRFQLLTDPTNYATLNRLGMVSRGKADAKAAVQQVSTGAECNPAEAPECTQDQDCVAWAARACLSATLAEAGRCLTGTEAGTAPEPVGKCSFNATEVAEHRAAKRAAAGAASGTCLGVAFSGGGDRGAFEAGVLKGLVAGAPAAADVAYAVASGVSVGSIVSSALSKFPVGEEADAAEFAVDTALSVTASAILVQWPRGGLSKLFTKGLIRGLLYESGIYDSSGVQALLQSKFPVAPLDPSKTYRTHSMLATDMGTGEARTFQFTGSSGTPEMISAILASTAIQGAFPMVVIDGVYYGDGGAVITNDVYSAVDMCRAAGFDSSAIQIDTVGVAGAVQAQLTHAQAVAAFVAAPEAVANVAERVQTIQAIDSLMAVIDFYRNAEPGLFRLNLFPAAPLPGTGLEFDPVQMQQMVDAGVAIGQGAFAAKASVGADGLPATCAYKTATVACGSDKDCFNWGVEKCGSQLSKTACAHDQRTCVFEK